MQPITAAAQPLDYDQAPWPDLCRSWRERRGLRFVGADLAGITHVPAKTWRQWEAGDRTPSPLEAWRHYLRLLDRAQP